MSENKRHILVIGAGVGGLAAAMRLSARGFKVTVLEQHDHIGGKMRTLPSIAGPVDAGPTVMTMRWVFDALFAECGDNLEDRIKLTPATILARHWWSDGSSLDLVNDRDQNVRNIAEIFGPKESKAFARFSEQAEKLFSAFEQPMMQTGQPDKLELALRALKQPSLLFSLLPFLSLERSLKYQFQDPRLRQLFGRYATYVGGSPNKSPALLSLIWHAESSGVWSVDGGLHKLPQAMSDVITERGGEIVTGIRVDRAEYAGGRISGVATATGEKLKADAVIFNGEPAALGKGFLGEPSEKAISQSTHKPRSLSACVWAFAAQPSGRELAHHNVFFGDDPRAEFGALVSGKLPWDATLYLCAQDRGQRQQTPMAERFEIIMNAPPINSNLREDFQTCHTQTFARLAQMGLRFDKTPSINTLTTPQEFNTLFPASDGSLYGRSPHGLTAALRRPTARTRLGGLYLAGGSAHPGAGIPMAALSGKHAAEAIMIDLTSTSTCRPTVTPGGMLTGSATMAPAQSRSSVS